MTVRPIYIFAGTTEGRELSCWLASRGIPCTVSVATDYGSLLMPEHPLLRVCKGRLSGEAMCAALREQAYTCVVDATHPFAVAVSGEIRQACQSAGLRCFRLARPTDSRSAAGTVFFDSLRDAAAYLDERQGTVLVTTGSKELPVLAASLREPSRIFARVLPSVESLRICNDCGVPGSHIIAMQGPFSREMNEVLLKACGASFLLTKESGQAGGYEEKIAAAEACGVTALVVRNPEKNSAAPEAASFRFPALLSELSSLYGMDLEPGAQRELVLAGIGPGGTGCMTEEVRAALSAADVLFASPRVMADELRVAAQQRGAAFVPCYRPDAVFAYLEEHPACCRPAVLFSGDSGFYSGASAFLSGEAGSAAQRSGWKLRLLCGISSVACFSARIGIPYQDWVLLSSHGRFCNVIGTLRLKRRCFLLVSGCRDVRRLGRKLSAACQNGVLGRLRIHVGYQLCRPDELMMDCSPEHLCTLQAEGLYVLLLEHDAAVQEPLVPGLPDEAFLREAHVPMTKCEVRAQILCTLRLTEHAVLYDIGAGTGSVTVEAARLCTGGKVFAVECRQDAFALLKQNISHFSLENVKPLLACAPNGLEELPPPSHVFIGGSGGNLRDILRAVLAKNPSVRIVLSVVTMETAVLVQQLLRELPLTDCAAVQLSVSRLEKLGSGHFLKAQNPVFIVSCNGNGQGLAKEDAALLPPGAGGEVWL